MPCLREAKVVGREAGEEVGLVLAQPVVCAHGVADGEVFVGVFDGGWALFLQSGESGVGVVGGRGDRGV